MLGFLWRRIEAIIDGALVSLIPLSGFFMLRSQELPDKTVAASIMILCVLALVAWCWTVERGFPWRNWNRVSINKDALMRIQSEPFPHKDYSFLNFMQSSTESARVLLILVAANRSTKRTLRKQVVSRNTFESDLIFLQRHDLVDVAEGRYPYLTARGLAFFRWLIKSRSE